MASNAILEPLEPAWATVDQLAKQQRRTADCEALSVPSILPPGPKKAAKKFGRPIAGKRAGLRDFNLPTFWLSNPGHSITYEASGAGGAFSLFRISAEY